VSKDGPADLELREICSEDARKAFSAAKARILAYWADECARNIDKLMTHFTNNTRLSLPTGSSAAARRSPLYIKRASTIFRD